MKGTIKRGQNEKEDFELKNFLQNDEKNPDTEPICLTIHTAAFSYICADFRECGHSLRPYR